MPSKPLAPAPGAYSPRAEQDLRNDLEERDQLSLKKDQHVELRAGAKFIVRSANGTRFTIEVSDAGVLSTSAL